MDTLFELMPGKRAIITKIETGTNLNDKISCLNIRENKQVQKITNQPLNGPIVIKIDNCQIALGKGIAQKIFIKMLK